MRILKLLGPRGDLGFHTKRAVVGSAEPPHLLVACQPLKAGFHATRTPGWGEVSHSNLENRKTNSSSSERSKRVLPRTLPWG